jgi:hypothetical protein
MLSMNYSPEKEDMLKMVTNEERCNFAEANLETGLKESSDMLQRKIGLKVAV